MASLEWRVINELIRSKDMNSVAKLGFNADHLAGEPEAAQIFEFIRSWYYNPNHSGQFPTMHAIKKRWPSFNKTGKSDVGILRTLLTECKAGAVVSDLRSLASLFQEMVDQEESQQEPELIIKQMQSYLAKGLYNAQHMSGFSVGEIARSVKAQYEAAATGAIYGIPWVWDPLTQDTLGKHKEDFIVIYGRMKSMKTWVLMVNAIWDYMVHNRRVLIWSREMNKAKMSLRAGSILAGVDYQCLKNGTLPYPLYQKAIAGIEAMAAAVERSEKVLEELKKREIKDKERTTGGDLFIVCGREAPTSLEAFDTIVEAFSPDVIYLDSMYHMECASMLRMKSDHERQRELAVRLKQRAVDWGVPVVGTTQANREGEDTFGETMADVGRTDALAQEADLILRVLYKKGSDPFEDDYEGYWTKLKERMASAKQVKSNGVANGHGRMRIGARSNGSKFTRANGVPDKIVQKLDRLPKKPRKSAELYIMIGGNREGVLEGFSIKCIPGYCWDVTRDNVTYAEAKEVFGKKKKGKGDHEGGGGGGGNRNSERRRVTPVDPQKAGMNFGG